MKKNAWMTKKTISFKETRSTKTGTIRLVFEIKLPMAPGPERDAAFSLVGRLLRTATPKEEWEEVERELDIAFQKAKAKDER